MTFSTYQMDDDDMPDQSHVDLMAQLGFASTPNLLTGAGPKIKRQRQEPEHNSGKGKGKGKNTGKTQTPSRPSGVTGINHNGMEIKPDMHQVLKNFATILLRHEASIQSLAVDREFMLFVTGGQGSPLPQMIVTSEDWHSKVGSEEGAQKPLKCIMVQTLMDTIIDRVVKVKTDLARQQVLQGLGILDSELNWAYLQWSPKEQKQIVSQTDGLSMTDAEKHLREAQQLLQLEGMLRRFTAFKALKFVQTPEKDPALVVPWRLELSLRHPQSFRLMEVLTKLCRNGVTQLAMTRMLVNNANMCYANAIVNGHLWSIHSLLEASSRGHTTDMRCDWGLFTHVLEWQPVRDHMSEWRGWGLQQDAGEFYDWLRTHLSEKHQPSVWIMLSKSTGVKTLQQGSILIPPLLEKRPGSLQEHVQAWSFGSDSYQALLQADRGLFMLLRDTCHDQHANVIVDPNHPFVLIPQIDMLSTADPPVMRWHKYRITAVLLRHGQTRETGHYTTLLFELGSPYVWLKNDDQPPSLGRYHSWYSDALYGIWLVPSSSNDLLSEGIDEPVAEGLDLDATGHLVQAVAPCNDVMSPESLESGINPYMTAHVRGGPLVDVCSPGQSTLVDGGFAPPHAAGSGARPESDDVAMERWRGPRQGMTTEDNTAQKEQGGSIGTPPQLRSTTEESSSKDRQPTTLGSVLLEVDNINKGGGFAMEVTEVAQDIKIVDTSCATKHHGVWAQGSRHLPLAGSIPAKWTPWQPQPSELVYSARLRQELCAACRDNTPQWYNMQQEVESRLRDLPECCVAQAEAVMKDCVSKHFPVRRQERTPKPFQQPDLVGQTRQMWALRKALQQQHGASLSAVFRGWHLRSAFQAISRKLRARSKEIRKQRLHTFLSETAECAVKKDMYSWYRQIALLCPKQARTKIHLRSDRGISLGPEDSLNTLRDYYSRLYEDNSFRMYDLPRLDELPFSADDLCAELRRLPVHKALTPTAVPAVMWRSQAQLIAPILHQELQHLWCRDKCRLPQRWIAGHLALLGKPSKPPTKPANLRPICLQHPCSKVLSGVVTRQASELITPMFSEVPCFAYLAHRSTSQCLLRVYEHCRLVRELCTRTREHNRTRKDKAALAGGVQVALDLQKAFDLVSRPFVLQCIDEAQLPSDLATSLKSSVLSGEYTIKHKGISCSLEAHRGIKQGAKDAPLLWNLVVLGVLKKLASKLGWSWIRAHLTIYADDMHICWVHKTGHHADRIFRELGQVLSCLEAMQLNINYDKSVVMMSFAGTRFQQFQQTYIRRLKTGPVIRCPMPDGTKRDLSLVSKTSYLGVIISYHRFERDTVDRRVQADRDRAEKICKLHQEVTHQDEQRFECPTCARSFRTEATLKRHQRDAHGQHCDTQPIFDPVRDALKGSSTCAHCGLRLRNKTNLMQHINARACPMFDPNAAAIQLPYAQQEATLGLLHDGGAVRLLQGFASTLGTVTRSWYPRYL
ncbi:Pol [Symbiodinium sp. CCMP2592]|nr:Pol [Symbiodinium sp. CCMP2592]